MLSQTEATYIASHFNVYDHNWMFYEELLGEAFFDRDVLSYCDGSAIYLAAFSLRSPGHCFERQKILDYASSASEHFKGTNVRLINIWGQFEDLPEKFGEYSLCRQSDYYANMFDSIFNVN